MFQKLEEISERGEISPREPVKALLLSLCPGLGQQYAGHLVRGIILYILLIVVSWLTAILFMFMESRASIVLFLIPVACFIAIAVDACLLAARQPGDYRLKWYNRSWIYAVVFLMLLVTVNPLMDIAIGRNVTRASLMGSISMEPTILRNDVLLVNKLTYRFVEPKRGDIVYIVFDKTKEGGLSEISEDHLIRRVIAVPGDTIEIRGKDVFVNHDKLEEPYAHHDEHIVPTANYTNDDRFGPAVVPPDSYFVLGDNRSYSIDSRILGFIDREKITGKVTKVYWSWNFDRMGDGTIKLDRVGITVR